MKKQLLDPIGTLCKCISLIFCDKYTKISIQDHILTLQTPSGYQFLVRMYNGDGRENVSELYYVIIRLIKWYIVPRYKIESDSEDEIETNNDNIEENKTVDSNTDDTNAYDISKSTEFIKMIDYLCEAFMQLQETYQYGNVVLALQFYINLLKDAVNGKYEDSRLPKYILEKDKEYENLIDYDKLRNLWDLQKIKKITQLYDDCMQLRDNKDLTEKTKNSLIKGNLSSIYSILEDADIEFQKLIQNSNRG